MILAKNVLSFMSTTLILTTSASISESAVASRSCVIGRGVSESCRRAKIAAASGCPIQIGKKRFVSTVLSNTIGCLPTMSNDTP